MTATVAAHYAQPGLLQSGWITGQNLIAGKAALVDVEYGKGHVVLFGFRPQHRAQTHGTFRTLFNAIATAALEPASLTP